MNYEKSSAIANEFAKKILHLCEPISGDSGFAQSSNYSLGRTPWQE